MTILSRHGKTRCKPCLADKKTGTNVLRTFKIATFRQNMLDNYSYQYVYGNAIV